MIGIIDYGAGNLFSVGNALSFLGIPYVISAEREALAKADKLILPGVGAFSAAMEKLTASGLVPFIKEAAAEKPLLGICLGMQLLFERGYEFKETAGLSLIPGSVGKMNPKNLTVPQMGWNELSENRKCRLTEDLKHGSYAYFVHSYAAECPPEYVASYTDYGGKVPAIVFNGNVYGCQFHPEKSGETGLGLLKKFGEIK